MLTGTSSYTVFYRFARVSQKTLDLLYICSTFFFLAALGMLRPRFLGILFRPGGGPDRKFQTHSRTRMSVGGRGEGLVSYSPTLAQRIRRARARPHSCQDANLLSPSGAAPTRTQTLPTLTRATVLSHRPTKVKSDHPQSPPRRPEQSTRPAQYAVAPPSVQMKGRGLGGV